MPEACVRSDEFEVDRTIEIDGLHFQLRKLRAKHLIFLKTIPEDIWLIAMPRFCVRIFDFERKWVEMPTEFLMQMPASTFKRLNEEILKQL